MEHVDLSQPGAESIPEPSRLIQLFDRFAYLREEGQVTGSGIDPGVAAHAGAVVRMFAVPEFKDTIASLVEKRQALPIDNIATLMFHASNKKVLFESIDTSRLFAVTPRADRHEELLRTVDTMHDTEYLAKVFNEDFWFENYQRIFQGPNTSALIVNDAMHYDLFYRVNQTNVAERYVSSFLGGLLMQLVQYKSGGKVELKKLDVGCSANLGLVQEERGIRFDDIEIQKLHSEGGTIITEPDAIATAAINKLLGLREQFGNSYGIDSLNVEEDFLSSLWVISNSFKPGELLPESNRKARFMELWRKKPESTVEFITGDFGDSQLEVSHPELNQGFNMISFFTVLNQHDPGMRQKMLNQAQKMLAKNGVILVQDFAYPDPNNAHELIFPNNWDAWQYRTLMYDSASGFQEIFRWQNGRCSAGALGAGKLILGNHTLTPADLVQSA